MAAKLLDDDFIAKIEQLEIVARKIISGAVKGDRLSKRRGHSTEFADFRPYVPGDDLRFLDWNVYARLEKLFLKLFLEEEDLRVRILLDRSPSMDYGTPPKLEYAKKVAAALGYIGLVNQDRVQVAGFAREARTVFGPARGRRQARRLLQVLEGLETEDVPGTSLERSCRDFALGQRGGGISLLVTDFFDRGGFEAGLRYLLAGGRSTEIYVIHVLAPQEIDPELTGDLRLVDAEDGMTVDVSISQPLLKRYRRTLEAFREEVRGYCAGHGLHYVFTSTAVPFDRLVLEYLRRRGLVR
ncbi:MAG: DUF58 domain-containing protein [Planctomycetes bacterium]|nr:DUF58 domain-containing protein [Planctomycetota bacterium]